MLEYTIMRWKLILFLICLVGIQPAQAQGDMLGLINGLRAQRGLPGYTINGALSVAAQQQAQWIVDNENVSHTHPDGSGPRTRALAAGYPSTQISENIYGGTNASAGDAWSFWLNSGIHYASLVSMNYQEIGIGIANGSRFNAYVLVFGGVGAPPPAPGSSNAASSGGGDASAPSGPPAYVGGLDANGNIMHTVQPGDTLGDIALIYGYGWDDLAYMMQLNGLANVRDLEVGSTFLVPPHDGTFTPSPGDVAAAAQSAPTEPAPPPDGVIAETPAPVETAAPADTVIPTPLPATITPFVLPTNPPQTQVTPTSAIATADGNILPPSFDDTTPAAAGVEVAALPTQGTLIATTATMQPRSGAPTWIIIALGVQVVIVVGAGIEFGRRALKKRK